MTKAAPPPARGDAAPAKGALEVTGKAAVQAPSDPVVEAYRRKLSMTLF